MVSLSRRSAGLKGTALAEKWSGLVKLAKEMAKMLTTRTGTPLITDRKTSERYPKVKTEAFLEKENEKN